MKILIEESVLRQALDALKLCSGVPHWPVLQPVITALRSALDDAEGVEPSCNPHPDAPHGFCRDSSHSAGRYVCECEGWEPSTNTDRNQAEPSSGGDGFAAPMERGCLPNSLSLINEAALITCAYDRIRAERTFAIDDLEYDLFAAGWKACASLVKTNTDSELREAARAVAYGWPNIKWYEIDRLRKAI